jgi:hypothetical protein
MRIVMWSGPRNLSTALMRSFGSRADCAVVDEPFYAAFLAESGADHPMRAQVIATGETDWRRVAVACTREPVAPPVRYEKHMTHHMLPGWGLDWMEGARIAFLIRDPAEVAASYAAKREACTADDIGTAQQGRLWDFCAERWGPPPVVDAADIRRAPAAVLRKLCAALGLPFDAAMLSWAPGRRATDGVWAKHWYGAVERSTGFEPPGPPPVLPPALARVADGVRPVYDRLAARALRP